MVKISDMCPNILGVRDAKCANAKNFPEALRPFREELTKSLPHKFLRGANLKRLGDEYALTRNVIFAVFDDGTAKMYDGGAAPRLMRYHLRNHLRVTRYVYWLHNGTVTPITAQNIEKIGAAESTCAGYDSQLSKNAVRRIAAAKRHAEWFNGLAHVDRKHKPRKWGYRNEIVDCAKVNYISAQAKAEDKVRHMWDMLDTLD